MHAVFSNTQIPPRRISELPRTHPQPHTEGPHPHTEAPPHPGARWKQHSRRSPPPPPRARAKVCPSCSEHTTAAVAGARVTTRYSAQAMKLPATANLPATAVRGSSPPLCVARAPGHGQRQRPGNVRCVCRVQQGRAVKTMSSHGCSWSAAKP